MAVAFDVYTQMRRIICERLASVIRIRTLRTTDTLQDAQTDDINVINNASLIDLTSPSTATAAAAVSVGQNTSSVERLLCSINELLETRVRLDARLRQQTDKNQQMMSEWMIAAAVIDRFCFIVFSFILVISSLTFALLLYAHA